MRWWQIRKRNVDLERELQSDFDLEEDEQIERGVSREEARYAAHRAFGNTALIREQVHEAWRTAPFERLWQDIRYALRQLRRSPGFTATVVLILGLGIGAATAIFSLIDAALLKMLPVRNPEQLVELKTVGPNGPTDGVFSYPMFKVLQNPTQALAGAIAFRRFDTINVENDGRSELAEGQVISGNYFTALGVRVILGRMILPTDESVPGQNPVAVISYDYWRTRFALDPGIVGKHILLNNSPFTIIGVTEPEFYGVQPGEKVDISVPLTMIASVNPAIAAAGGPADALKAPFRNWLFVIGRLQNGTSSEIAAASLEPVFAQAMREAAVSPLASPAMRRAFLNSRLALEPAGNGLASLRRQFSKPLWIVMSISGLLLVITCTSVANLLMVRANAREKEFAVRLALGARRLSLVRQLLTESILLGLGGGTIGTGLAYWSCSSLLALMAHGRNPVFLSVHPDLVALGFALGISLLTALAFGTIPAWRTINVGPSSGLTLKTNFHAATAHRQLAKSFIVFQLAVSLVMVIGAGLLTRTLANLKNFYPGFNQNNVLIFSVLPNVIGYKDFTPLYEQLLNRLQTIPAVSSATLSAHEPLSTSLATTTPRVKGAVRVQGAVPLPEEDLASVNIEPVGPYYFHTMQIPLLRGRDVSSSDRNGTPRVAFINESMARNYFGDADPIGRFVSIPYYRGDTSWLQIVGEVYDIKVPELRESSSPMLYMPMFQAPEGRVTFEVRTSMNPEYIETAMREEVKAIDSRLPIYSVKTLGDQLNQSLIGERLVAVLSNIFGLLALLLTSVGLYGLMAYTVSRRTGEIGVRMALGAQRGRIARLILGEALLIVAFAMGVGLPIAAVASRLVASRLFGLKPIDPLTFLVACVIVVSVAIAASYLPARRAASVDPMRALRNE